MAFSLDLPLACLTPVSASTHSPSLSPLWAYQGPPPSVRLTDSLSAIIEVVHAVLDERVRKGDMYLSYSMQARQGPVDLRHVIEYAPVPTQRLEIAEDTFFELQYLAALHGETTVFDCPTKPQISLKAYIERLASYGSVVSNCVYITALWYMDRLLSRSPALFLNSWNVHHLLLAGFAAAAKYHEDCYIANAEFARIGGVTLHQMNTLEAAFLEGIYYSCFVSPEQFEHFEQSLISESLESACGLSVFQALRQYDIVGVERAVRRATTWAAYDVPLSPLYELTGANQAEHEIRAAAAREAADRAWDEALSFTGRGLSRERRRALHLAALARAQAAFDYPDIPLFPQNLYELEQANAAAEAYPEGGLRRFHALRAIARCIPTAATLLPNRKVTSSPPGLRSYSGNYLCPPGFEARAGLQACSPLSASKTAVSYLLNDAPTPEFSESATMYSSTMEQECGIYGLL